MAIGRVGGPMLLSTLDRQGIDLQFTTDGLNLVYLDFSNFTMGVRQSGGRFVFNVNGNAVLGSVVMENNAIITTANLNQNLTLQANGIANVTVINANVISGRVDGTVIGALNPRPGYFTSVTSSTFIDTDTITSTGLGQFKTANVNNLRSNHVTFTAANNNILTDDSFLQFFTSNSTLVVGNLVTLLDQIYDTISVANLIVRTSVANSIPYFAANGYLLTNSNLTISDNANTLNVGKVVLDSTNTNQLLFVDSSDQTVKGTDYLTFDGLNMRANGITRLGNLNISNETISTPLASNKDIVIAPDGTGVISVTDSIIRDLATPTDPSDATTKQYVDDLVAVTTISTRSIFQGDTNILVSDDNLFTANIVFTVQNTEVGRLVQDQVRWQDITFNDATISTAAGALILQPYNNDRIQFQTSKAVTLPVGPSASRPVAGLEYQGDFRYNTELGTIEWYDGSQWENPANSTVTSQTIIPDGISATFTLTQPSTTEAVLVNFNGVIQRPSTTYSVASDQITFTSVPLTTDIIEVRFFNGTVAQATNPIVVDKPYSNVGMTTTTIDSWYVNQYRGAKYTYTARTTTGDNVELGDIKLVHDNIDAYFNTSFVSKTGNSMVTWSTSIDFSGVLSLQAQGTHVDVNIKWHAVYLTDPDVM